MFEDYKALVHSTADAYDKKSRAKKCATHNAYSHNLDIYNPVGYPYKGYDLDMDMDMDIDMIYANAANTHEGMILPDHFHQMTPEGHKIWVSLPPEDQKLICDQDSPSMSTNMDAFGHAQGQGGGCGCRAFS